MCAICHSKPAGEALEWLPDDLYPRVLQGPFSLADVSEVKEYAGDSPLVRYSVCLMASTCGSTAAWRVAHPQLVRKIMEQGDCLKACDLPTGAGDHNGSGNPSTFAARTEQGRTGAGGAAVERESSGWK